MNNRPRLVSRSVRRRLVHRLVLLIAGRGVVVLVALCSVALVLALVVFVSPVRLVLLVVGRNECRGSCRGLVPRADAGRCRSRFVPHPVLAYR